MRGDERDVYDLPLAELERMLTEQQKRFVAELERDGRPKEAAIRAGYSAKTAESQASRMLKLPKIAAYRRARAIDLYKRQGITPEWVGNQLLEVYNRCAEGYEVVAINDLTSPKMLAHLLKYDTAQGSFCGKIGESMGMFRQAPKQEGEMRKSVEEFLQSLPDDGREF